MKGRIPVGSVMNNSNEHAGTHTNNLIIYWDRSWYISSFKLNINFPASALRTKGRISSHGELCGALPRGRPSVDRDRQNAPCPIWPINYLKYFFVLGPEWINFHNDSFSPGSEQFWIKKHLGGSYAFLITSLDLCLAYCLLVHILQRNILDYRQHSYGQTCKINNNILPMA